MWLELADVLAELDQAPRGQRAGLTGLANTPSIGATGCGLAAFRLAVGPLNEW